MHLHPGEPAAGPWRPWTEADLDDWLRARLGRADGLPAGLVMVDGRGGSGKTTFAERVARLLGGAVLHTDDIAWHLHQIAWDDVLVDDVIEPWRRGEGVSLRPPGWIAKGREGTVDVPARPVLVVEGVASGRRRLAALADVTVWVQSDRDEARRRGLERDMVLHGRTMAEAVAEWDDWVAVDEPFLAADRPWTRADLIVNGTPTQVVGPAADIVYAVAGPVRRARRAGPAAPAPL